MNAVTPDHAALRADVGISVSNIGVAHDLLLLSLRSDFRDAMAVAAEANNMDDISDESLEAAAKNLDRACWAVANAPPAQTATGRALKAAAAKHQLRGEFGLDVPDSWPDRSLELVWHVLTEFAGDEYIPAVPLEWEPPGQVRAVAEVAP